MTTPETPGETPAQPQRVPSATDAAPRRGFNFGNKRFIIGGAIGGAALLVIIAAVAVLQLLGGGSAAAGSLLKLVPEDAQFIILLSPQTLREKPDDFPGDYDDFAEGLQETIEDEFNTEEIDLAQVGSFSGFAVNPDFQEGTILLQGDFAFDDLRDDWADQGFEADSYKGYELWQGQSYYALLEAEGALITSDSAELLKDIIKNLDRGSGSLADAEDNDLKRILDRLARSPLVFALAGDSCGDAVRGCRGVGVAYAGADLDREEVATDLVVLFSNRRRSERAFDDYDDVAELMESILEGYVGVAGEFAVIPDADGVDVDDIAQDGDFVRGVGAIALEQ